MWMCDYGEQDGVAPPPHWGLSTSPGQPQAGKGDITEVYTSLVEKDKGLVDLVVPVEGLNHPVRNNSCM